MCSSTHRMYSRDLFAYGNRERILNISIVFVPLGLMLFAVGILHSLL